MLDLKALPVEHPLRTTPLGLMEVQQRCVYDNGQSVGRWINVERSWKIASVCFNDLAPRAWIAMAEWRGAMPVVIPLVNY